MKPSDQRKYHLTFCTLCKNSSFDRDQGLVCSFTNKKAQFSHYCTDFELSDSKYTKLVTELDAKIKLRGHNSETYHVPAVKFGSRYPLQFNDKARTVIKPNKYAWIIFLPSTIIAGIALLDAEKGSHLYVEILFTIVIGLTFSILSIFVRKPLLTIKNNSIKIYNQEILTNDLVTIGKREWIDINLRKQTEYFFGTKTGGLITTMVNYPYEYLKEKLENSTHNMAVNNAG